MNKRERLLRSLSSAQFALWELHLYLDTHSSDLQAIAMHAEYEKKYSKLLNEYESAYGPLTPSYGDGVEWLKNPWPWEEQGDED